MKAQFEFEIEDNENYTLILMRIIKFFSQLNKITLTCSCGEVTESGRHLTTSPEEQSDKDYDFIKEHTNCKGAICQTKNHQTN